MSSMSEEEQIFKQTECNKKESKAVQEVLSNTQNAYVYIICYRF